MKKYLILILMLLIAFEVNTTYSQTGQKHQNIDQLHRLFFEKKIELFIRDLVNHDLQKFIFYFDPKHIQTNIWEAYRTNFDFNDFKQVNKVILEWRFLAYNYQDYINNIREIESVISYKIIDNKIEFTIIKKDNRLIKIYSYIDWQNLTLLGAAG